VESGEGIERILRAMASRGWVYRVESGEGIESLDVSILWTFLSIKWNPVKELKDENVVPFGILQNLRSGIR